MIHGVQKMTLTHASVQEALQDYLTGHLSVPIALKSWGPTPNTYGDDVTVDIQFEQQPDATGEKGAA